VVALGTLKRKENKCGFQTCRRRDATRGSVDSRTLSRFDGQLTRESHRDFFGPKKSDFCTIAGQETIECDQYTHCSKCFSEYTFDSPYTDPLGNAWSGQTISCCAHAPATGQENGPCREHDGGVEERHGGDGDTSSVPGA